LFISQQIAANAVALVLSGRNLTQALPQAQAQVGGATPQQRAGAADLSYGTLRYYASLEAYLGCLLDKPLRDAYVHALLLVALYQLLHDQATEFTIVNQAVQAARQAKPRWATGLVNGVLRNFLRQKNVLIASFRDDLAVQYAYPKWWIDKLQRQYPNRWAEILATGNSHPPMTLRVNKRKISLQTYAQQLNQLGIPASIMMPSAIMLHDPMTVEKIPGFAEGLVSVQDYGAQWAPRLLDLQTGMRVLDACCAPGGKVGHLLESADVQLTALDSDPIRLQRVASNLRRLGLHATLKAGDAATTQGWHVGECYDRILADVPCSASGIVRRHVDIKWLRRATDTVTFMQQQSAILLNLWQLLTKGGKLLYVTCSVFEEENQQQINHFLATHPDATQLPIDLDALECQHLTMEQGQLMPNTLHDGLFYAVLQKT